MGSQEWPFEVVLSRSTWAEPFISQLSDERWPAKETEPEQGDPLGEAFSEEAYPEGCLPVAFSSAGRVSLSVLRNMGLRDHSVHY